ncbi:hypothetical protein CROQUDRAFT_725849 [Cronartium quercuum f. sp. fusiforme G11]|uniref:Coenzyme Q-binding protein COQ10 START domain-containing protein n=1 Tax=Cronartium quercuum f. sp. fusiforme G11 TaxID=708437 RepID=A0A9P6N727_9BASI|nr:hypothetical protein CROQUDRAFT_725849 [Cronartium quercuum f. sp. fusiforme G11]
MLITFSPSAFRLTFQRSSLYCFKYRSCSTSQTRTFFSLPSFPRSTTQDLSTANNLTASDRYSKRGELLIYKETNRLPYTKKQLYAVIADVEKYPHFVPYCLRSNLLSSRALEGHENKRGQDHEPKPWIHGGYSGETHFLESEFVIGYKTFEERYTSHVECRKWEMIKATATHSSLFKHLTSTWKFRSPQEISPKQSLAGNPESSYVSLQLAFTPSPSQPTVGEFFWKSTSERMVLAFESRLEQVYGKQTNEFSHQSQGSLNKSVTELYAQHQ